MVKNPSAGFDIDAAKNNVSFYGSAMTLEFILSKDQNDETSALELHGQFQVQHTATILQLNMSNKKVFV